MSKRKVTAYTEKFKKSSAELSANEDKPIAQTAKDLGINETTLYGWVSKYYPKKTSQKASATTDNLLIELKQLRRENIRLKQERDILKKAL